MRVVDAMADLECTGSLSWSQLKPGEMVSGSFTVSNTGDEGSVLDWGIVSYPDWGAWTFTPSSGSDLMPADGDVEVTVSVVAPTAFSVSRFVDADEEYSGQVLVENSEDSSDQGVIDVTMTVPHVSNSWMWLWNLVCERFPLLELVYGSLFV